MGHGIPPAAVVSWLAPYRVLWADRLAALSRHLDEMPDRLSRWDCMSRFQR